MAPTPASAPLGLYIHVPFCSHICPYCDFVTYSGQDALIPAYVDAVCRDIEQQASLIPGRSVSTIFFGGGTPSLLSAEQIARVLDECRSSMAVAIDAEITLEANPNSVDAAYFAQLRAAGVNRLSLGVQTTHRRGLRVLGRQHEAADAERAFTASRDAGFDNVSLDLIFGWPGQTIDDWTRDLEHVLGWAGGGPQHLSLYSLIVEPGTPMADAVERGILQVLDEDACADLYEAAIAVMAAAGWTHYEVANWARTPALGSRHNAVYWRNGDYLGIGAGAYGHVAGTRVMNHMLPRTYIEAIGSGAGHAANIERIEPRVAMGETMMLGLRLLHEGVGDLEFAARHQVGLTEMFGDGITQSVTEGLLERLPDRVRLTPRGLMLANDVCARFL